MLDIVPAQKDQLPLPVEVVDIDDPEAGLPRAPTILAWQHQAAASQPAQHQA
jgi:hypothetical protein